MSESRIIDLTAKQSLESGDYFVVDNETGGTKKISGEDFVDNLNILGEKNYYKVIAELKDTTITKDNYTIAFSGNSITVDGTVNTATYRKISEIITSIGAFSVIANSIPSGVNIQIQKRPKDGGSWSWYINLNSNTNSATIPKEDAEQYDFVIELQIATIGSVYSNNTFSIDIKIVETENNVYTNVILTNKVDALEEDLNIYGEHNYYIVEDVYKDTTITKDNYTIAFSGNSITVNGTINQTVSLTISKTISTTGKFIFTGAPDVGATYDGIKVIVVKRAKGSSANWSYYGELRSDENYKTITISKEDSEQYEFNIQLLIQSGAVGQSYSNLTFELNWIILETNAGTLPNTKLTERVVLCEDELNEHEKHNMDVIAPNGEAYVVQVKNDGTLQAIPRLPSNILYIGNSLLLGFGNHGAASTTVNDDYYAKVNSYLTNKGKTLTTEKVRGVNFEDATSDADVETWITNSLSSKMSNDRQLVIIQLGDNVNTPEKHTQFTKSCNTLCSYIRTNCPNARVAWVAMWYYSYDKLNNVKNACEKYGCIFVDIHDLHDVEGNQNHIGATYIDENGNEQTITDSGVASHPSDQGFTQIANRIISQLFE